MKSIFSKNLKFLREKADLKQDALAKQLDISRSILSYYENGKGEPTMTALKKISFFFNVSIDSLVNQNLMLDNSFLNKTIKKTLNEEPLTFSNNELSNLLIELENKKKYYLKLINSDLPDKISEIDTIINYLTEYSQHEFSEELIPDVIDLEEYKNTEKYIKYRDIPVPGSVSAGDPCYVFDDIIDTVSIPEDLLSPRKEYYILYIKGDSMNELFKPGEPLLIEYTNYVLSNDIAIVLVGTDEATIKKVTFDDDYITLIPMSTNPKHKPKTHNIKDVCIQGKVVGKLSDILKPSL